MKEGNIQRAKEGKRGKSSLTSAFFFPTLGHYSYERKSWSLPVHVWLHRHNSSRASHLALRAFKRALVKTEITNEQLERLYQRTRLFVAHGVPRQRILLQLGEKLFVIGKSRRNGHLRRFLYLLEQEMSESLGSFPQGDSWLPYRASMADGRVLEGGEIHLLRPEGISVISDIDDTLKQSGVADKRQLLVNTFLNPYSPVSGMVSLYQQWSRQGAAFHYVSSTPWQLFEQLEHFVSEWKLPKGSFHLKSIYWKDLSWLKLLASPEGTKPKVIEPILRSFPYRKFILVGDAVERDPEIYASFAKRYPDRVVKVFIRDESGSAEARMKASGLPQHLWQVFHCGADLEVDLLKICHEASFKKTTSIALPSLNKP